MSKSVDGDSVMNAPASCVERSCESATCGIGSTCSDANLNDGYKCGCNASYHGDDVWNNEAVCTERICNETGFLSGNSCGDHTDCEEIEGNGQGIRCSCISSFKGETQLNASTKLRRIDLQCADCGTEAGCEDGENDIDGYRCTCNILSAQFVVERSRSDLSRSNMRELGIGELRREHVV